MADRAPSPVEEATAVINQRGSASKKKAKQRGKGFVKGAPSANPAGRPKGARNKTTVAVKEAIIQCFEDMGGVEALVKWAKSNPDDFYKIYARLIPHEVTGPEGGPVQYQEIRRVLVDPTKTH